METATASTNTSSASTAQSAGVDQSSSNSQASSQGNTPNQQSSTSEKQSAQDSTKKVENLAENDFEEITVGSKTVKASKEIAQLVKNLERGFQTKAQEAATNKKLLSLAQNNPEAFFQETGKDPYEFAEALLAKRYELMNMTPEQRRLHDLEAQDAKRNEAENASKKEVIDAIIAEFGSIPEGADKATKEQLINYYRHQVKVANDTKVSLDTEIGNAFKESGLPKSKMLLAKVAFEMSSALKRNSPLTAAQAIAKVSKEYFEGAKEAFGTMDVKRIHEIFGDEFLEKIRKYDLDQVTASAALKFGQTQPGQAQASSQQQEKKVYSNERDWINAITKTF